MVISHIMKNTYLIWKMYTAPAINVPINKHAHINSTIN